MKKKKLILWTSLISIAILMIIFYSLSRFVKEKTYPVFLLNKNVPAGCMIEKEMIRSVMIPESCIFPTAFKKAADIVGSILTRDMNEGDVLCLQDIQSSDSRIDYPTVSQGKLLYTLAFKPEDANGWWIRTGNEINLLLYDSTIDSNGSIEENKILQIDSLKIIRIMDESGNEIIQSGKPPKMVCLEMTEAQTQMLFEAENGKKIKLIAKNSEKNTESERKYK